MLSAGTTPAQQPPDVEAVLGREDAAGYRYEPAGRRDPFTSLLAPVVPVSTTRCRCSGPSSLLISELVLRGVVKTGKGYTALLEGPDHKSYFLKAGERFYDGFLVEVQDGGLLVRQEVVDPLSPVRSRDVRVQLHAEDLAPVAPPRR